MSRARVTLWDVLFMILLVVALPVAAFHVSQGRYGNAAVALGAFVVGVGVLRWGWRHA